jgi:hypothetical protein
MKHEDNYLPQEPQPGLDKWTRVIMDELRGADFVIFGTTFLGEFKTCLVWKATLELVKFILILAGII